MKNFKKVLALVLVIATVLSFATVASAKTTDYKDAKDVKNTEAVDVLSAIGVLNGYTDGEYKPNRVISRAEAAKIIAMFDNGDNDIKELYAPVNVTDVAAKHWAQSYISYCYHTGIIAGIGNNKYAPEAEVTGVQFLKMVLVVLGFDAKEEGLVGTGYSVRTRNLAREMGLLAGIGNDFDYTKGLTRDNAAQIMLNALQCNTVEYGKSYTNVGKNTLYISDSKAVYTNELLAEEWNLEIQDATDAFGRPGHKWAFHHNNYPNHTKDVVIGTYMDTPVATYTTKVLGCDVYDDLGVKLDVEHTVYDWSDKDRTYNYDKTVKVTGAQSYLDGQWQGREVLGDNKTTFTGAQGQLTEVYAIDCGKGKVIDYRIVHINTYLAKVAAVNAEKKDGKGHVTAARNISFEAKNDQNQTVYTVYTRAGNDYYNKGALTTFAYADNFETEDFAKGDYVLVNGVAKKTDGGFWTITPVVVTAAKSEQTKLTGISKDNMTYYVNGTATPVACKYAYEADRTYVNTENWASLTFFYDAYGNVIGTTAYEAPKNFAIIDSLNVNYETYGKANVYATLYTVGGTKLENVKINKIYSTELLDTFGVTSTGVSAGKWIPALDDGQGFGNHDNEHYSYQFQWNGSSFYVENFYAKIFDYIVNEDGTYDLFINNYTNVITTGSFSLKKGASYLTGKATVGGVENTTVYLRVTDKTQFALQTKASPNGEYIFKTGTADIPNTEASAIAYKLAADGTAEFVYMAQTVDADVAGIAYYVGGSNYYNAGKYYYDVLKVVDGELKADTITSTKKIVVKSTTNEITANVLYKFITNADGETVAVEQKVYNVTKTVDANGDVVDSLYSFKTGSEDAFIVDLSGDYAKKFVNKVSGSTVTADKLVGHSVYVLFDDAGKPVNVFFKA